MRPGDTGQTAPSRPPSIGSARQEFAESHTENLLKDCVLIAASISGSTVVLSIQDDYGTWYRDSSGMNPAQMEALERVLAGGPTPDESASALEDLGLRLIEAIPLLGRCQRAIGTLSVVSHQPIELSEDQREGLRMLAMHLQSIVVMDHQRSEARTAPRAPSAASFVPGLVHELGSFIFGISASLDAFEAKFEGLDDVSRYGANIRRSLDRMSDFITELRDYGYPQRLSWENLELEPLLRESVEAVAPLADKLGINLQLQVEGALPPIQADRHGLQMAFTRMVDLVLHQVDPNGTVVLRVGISQSVAGCVILGHLDFSSSRMKNVDPARLFEPFYFRVSGLGRLTLPGARRIIESHGGTLTAGQPSSRHMRFSFTLPADSSYPLPASRQS